MSVRVMPRLQQSVRPAAEPGADGRGRYEKGPRLHATLSIYTARSQPVSSGCLTCYIAYLIRTICQTSHAQGRS